MSIYVDTLATMIEDEKLDNGATREDFERALDLVYGQEGK